MLGNLTDTGAEGAFSPQVFSVTESTGQLSETGELELPGQQPQHHRERCEAGPGAVLSTAPDSALKTVLNVIC